MPARVDRVFEAWVSAVKKGPDAEKRVLEDALNAPPREANSEAPFTKETVSLSKLLDGYKGSRRSRFKALCRDLAYNSQVWTYDDGKETERSFLVVKLHPGGGIPEFVYFTDSPFKPESLLADPLQKQAGDQLYEIIRFIRDQVITSIWLSAWDKNLPPWSKIDRNHLKKATINNVVNFFMGQRLHELQQQDPDTPSPSRHTQVLQEFHTKWIELWTDQDKGLELWYDCLPKSQVGG